MPALIIKKTTRLIACFLLLFPLTSWSAGSDKTAMLSLEEIVKLRQVSKARMNHTGDAVAYILSVPRELYKDDDGPAWKQLHVVNLEGESRPYFAGKVNVSDLAWSATGSELFFVGKRDVEADHPNIFRIALDGGEAQILFEGKSGIESIHPSPDGKTVAFLATDPAPEDEKTLSEKGFKAMVYEESARPTRVWLLDVDSGEVVAQEIAGSVSAFEWSPDGNYYAVALAPTPLVDDDYMARDIFVISASNAKIRNQMGLVGKMGEFRWSPDGRHIAWIGSEDINDPSPGRLYSASAQGGEHVELVPGYAGQVEDFFWQDKDQITWIGSRGMWTEQGRTSLRKPRSPGDAPDSGVILRAVDAHPGQRFAAAVADSPGYPSEVFLLRTGEDPVRLTHSNAILDERRLARQEVITYEARDGLKLEAVVVHPAGKVPAGGSPMVMMIHGGPEGHYSNGWMSAYSRPAQALAAQGYVVVYPNYRGSTGRGVAFSKMGQHGYAGPEFNDIVDAKQHLVTSGLADSGKTGITGGSYGGYASMWAASALSEHFAAAVAFVGISDQISKFGTTDIPKEMYNVHARSWPWEDWVWMLERSPIYHADKVRTPLLIMHGQKDTRVHPSQSLEMYRHVKVRTDTPVRLVYYPGEGHGNRNTAAQYDYALRLERWMNHFLKGEGGDAPPFEIDHASRLEDPQDDDSDM